MNCKELGLSYIQMDLYLQQSNQYPTLTSTLSQTYTLVATNANGCSSMDSMNVSFSTDMITDFSSELSCNFFNTDLVIDSIVGGISPFEYSLNQ